MAIFRNLAALALREVAQGVWQSVGGNGLQAVVGRLSQHFTDQSQRLAKALQRANDHAWTALEVALAGESLWQRVKLVFASGENKAFREQVQVFLNAVPFAELSGSQFRQSCLRELQAAGKAGLLTAGVIDTDSVVERAAAFTRFADPERLLDVEWLAIRGVADELDQAGYSNLAQLLSVKAVHGAPLLIVAVQYFFRREVETDRELFQGLSWAKLEGMGQAQEEGFASLARALDQHAGSFQELLAGVHEVVIATHDKVLDILGEQRRQGDVVQGLYDKVIDQQRRFALLGRELRPGDSLSIRGENERQLVKALVLRFRALPTKQQQQMPALINALGKLEVLAGDFDPAQQLFREVATIVPDARAQAEVHYNAYQTALERRDWALALQELIEAIKANAKRFAPFPVRKYQPRRILGAGGFGVAFLCKHRYMDASVVVKTLSDHLLGRELDKVFNEAHTLQRLDHPAIIRIQDCGWADPAGRSRPYVVMDYFDGMTLDEWVQKNGPLAVEDLLAVAYIMAEGMQAAHAEGVLHRDLKPANVLVRKAGSGWDVKLIDFGLALRSDSLANTQHSSKTRALSALANSIAGTIDYAAPEQLGKLPGTAVGTASDVYAFARTCCYALFRTSQPLPKHWQALSDDLAALLGQCLEEEPAARTADFTAVLAKLDAVSPRRAVDPPRHASSREVGQRARERDRSSSAMVIEDRPDLSSSSASPTVFPEQLDTNGALAREMNRVRALDDVQRLHKTFLREAKARNKTLALAVGIPLGIVAALLAAALIQFSIAPPGTFQHEARKQADGLAWIFGILTLCLPLAVILFLKRSTLRSAIASRRHLTEEILTNYPQLVRACGGRQVLDNSATVAKLAESLEARQQAIQEQQLTAIVG